MVSYKTRWYILILFLLIAALEIYLKENLVSFLVVICAIIIGIIGLISEKPTKKK